MTGDELRALQAPLKDRYRGDPEAARITLRADSDLAAGISCKLSTGTIAGLHPATGGDGSLACSGDMLLEALAACFGVTLRAVSTSLGIEASGTIHVEGDLDFRGTLGVDKTAPVGFTDIRVRAELTGVPDDQRAKLLQLSERYCVVLQTLRNGPRIEIA